MCEGHSRTLCTRNFKGFLKAKTYLLGNLPMSLQLLLHSPNCMFFISPKPVGSRQRKELQTKELAPEPGKSGNRHHFRRAMVGRPWCGSLLSTLMLSREQEADKHFLLTKKVKVSQWLKLYSFIYLRIQPLVQS